MNPLAKQKIKILWILLFFNCNLWASLMPIPKLNGLGQAPEDVFFWISTTVSMAVIIEWLVYKYFGFIRYPLLCSLITNLIGFFVIDIFGNIVLLVIISGFFGHYNTSFLIAYVIYPLAYIFLSCLVKYPIILLLRFIKHLDESDKKEAIISVCYANALSIGMLFLMIFLKSQ